VGLKSYHLIPETLCKVPHRACLPYVAVVFCVTRLLQSFNTGPVNFRFQLTSPYRQEISLTDAVLAHDPAALRSPATPPFPISLEFALDVSPFVRARISYAFRVFAAIYSHTISESPAGHSIRCLYGRLPCPDGALFHIPALYQDTIANRANRGGLARMRYTGEDFHLSFGVDPASGKPDWLGEIFQWLSSSYEAGCAKHDDIGRIPYSETVFARGNISPRTPHASLLMAWLENAIGSRGPAEALPKAPSPLPGIDHLVVCSHDIDFYFTDPVSAAIRVIKNMGLALQLYRSFSYFTENCKMLLALLGGKRVGDFLPGLLDTLEREGFRSTLFAVARRGHRRDPGYRLEHLLPRLRDASRRGFPTGLHGSYRSVIEDQTLAEEARAFRDVLGVTPIANRQHWLRFNKHEKLFAQLKLARVKSDSTLGFHDQIGFRNGASFAFPPYDFENERPHDFLEIPLAIMDGSLAATSRALGQEPQMLAEEVLANSRKYGWGGISVLWHNPIEPLSVPRAINQVFWNCASQQREQKESWMSVDQFLAACLPRYQSAGLMKEVSLDHDTVAVPKNGNDSESIKQRS